VNKILIRTVSCFRNSLNLEINSKLDKMRVILHHKTLIRLYVSLGHLLQKNLSSYGKYKNLKTSIIASQLIFMNHFIFLDQFNLIDCNIDNWQRKSSLRILYVNICIRYRGKFMSIFPL